MFNHFHCLKNVNGLDYDHQIDFRSVKSILSCLLFTNKIDFIFKINFDLKLGFIVLNLNIIFTLKFITRFTFM